MQVCLLKCTSRMWIAWIYNIHVYIAYRISMKTKILPIGRINFNNMQTPKDNFQRDLKALKYVVVKLN